MTQQAEDRRVMQAYKPAVAVLNAIDLGPELAGMERPSLKLQLTTYAPGKAGSLHDHKGRPEVVYVLEGAITDHRDGIVTEYRKGESYVVNNGAAHRMENRGTVPALLLVAMVWDDGKTA